MDEKYISLFIELAQANETLAEQVMELDRQKNDEKGEETAQIMRNDFQSLGEKIKSSPSSLNKNDFAKLLVGALVVTNNITEKIAAYQIAVQGYKLDLIPKLQRILDEVENDEQLNKLVQELFSELKK